MIKKYTTAEALNIYNKQPISHVQVERTKHRISEFLWRFGTRFGGARGADHSHTQIQMSARLLFELEHPDLALRRARYLGLPHFPLANTKFQ